MGHAAVRDLRDLPLLYVVEGENEMGAPKKTRAELLDKIIQFIWDYQDRHGGVTPSQTVIGRHVGVDPTGMGYYIAILVNDGRLNKISPRPFRVTIIDSDKDNQRAIARFKQIRERLERANEREREQIRARQQEEAAAEQHARDHSNALALVDAAADEIAASAGDTVVPDVKPKAEVIETSRLPRPAIAKNRDRQMRPPEEETATEDRLDQFVDAHARVRAINKEVKALMPRLLKIADERDLVFELLSRGYRVDKVR